MKSNYSSLALGAIIAASVGCSDEPDWTEVQKIYIDVPKESGMYYEAIELKLNLGFIKDLEKNNSNIDSLKKYSYEYFTKDMTTSVVIGKKSVLRGNPNEVKYLIQDKITSAVANSYSKRFRTYDLVKEALNIGLTPQIEKEYGVGNPADEYKNFEREKIISFKVGLYPEEAKKYEGFELSQARILFRSSCPPEIANKYPDYYKEHRDVLRLFEEGVTPNKLEGYKEGISYDDIFYYAKDGILPEKVNPYHVIFERIAVYQFIENHISAKKANKYVELIEDYGAKIDYLDILRYEKHNINFNLIKKKVEEEFVVKTIKE